MTDTMPHIDTVPQSMAYLILIGIAVSAMV